MAGEWAGALSPSFSRTRDPGLSCGLVPSGGGLQVTGSRICPPVIP